MKCIKGSALPTVMVVTILICLLVLFTFMLFDMNALLYAGYYSERQRKEYLNSAIILYSCDSTFTKGLDGNGEYQLYKEEDASKVRFQINPWGFYEVVNVSSIDLKYHTTRLMGRKLECLQKAALWVSSRDMPLSLAGNTKIDGTVFAPLNGINYIQIENKPFTGEAVAEHRMHLSDRELPAVDSAYTSRLDAWCNKMRANIQPISINDQQTYYSFMKDPACFKLAEKTGELTMRGNVILYADEVTISSTTSLTDVILVARKVTIEKGFTGSMQIMASDTVILKENVRLCYPSGVLLNGNSGNTYLEINSGSTLNGYAIIKGSVDKKDILRISPNYRQERKSFFGGLLYVDGIATLSGIVSGATYIKECYYLPVNGSYAGVLFNARIDRNEQGAFPSLFKSSPYKRKEIKSMH